MKHNRQLYFIALGSNLAPEIHIVKMIEALFTISSVVDVSEIIRTEPVGLNSTHHFLNTVIRLKSSMDQKTLKTHLSAIEEKLGRDRSDPNRKNKDRTADLDILFSLKEEEKFVEKQLFEQEEFYILVPLLLLLKHLNYETNMNPINSDNKRIELSFVNQLIGIVPKKITLATLNN